MKYFPILSAILITFICIAVMSCSDECVLVDSPSNCTFDPEEVNIPCDANIPSFYYDKKKKSCVAFEYGGCNDSPNEPFSTLAECQECICSK